MLPTIDWQGDAIVMVDQRKLPGQEIYVRCRSAQEVAKAIRTMVIRGAPAIGVHAVRNRELGARGTDWDREATSANPSALDLEQRIPCTEYGVPSTKCGILSARESGVGVLALRGSSSLRL